MDEGAGQQVAAEVRRRRQQRNWTLGPGDERRSDAHRRGSREVVLVTGGMVTVTVGSAEPVSLGRRQSAVFSADEPHSYRNDGRKSAAFVPAVHEPSGGVT